MITLGSVSRRMPLRRPPEKPPIHRPRYMDAAETYAPVELDARVRAHLRQITYDGNSPLAGRVNEVVGWAEMDMPARLAFLRRFVEDTAKDPAISTKTARILDEAGAAVRDYRAQWAALLHWVQRNIRYVNEADERFQSPQYSLSERHGDCDDFAILLAALGHAHRLPWRFVLSGRDRKGNRVRWCEGVGKCPPNVEWGHIYLGVGGPPFRPTWWTFAEPTLQVPLGWDVMSARGKITGRADMGGASHVGYGADGATPPATATSTADKGGGLPSRAGDFARAMPWPLIAGTFLASVASFFVTQRLLVPRRRRR